MILETGQERDPVGEIARGRIWASDPVCSPKRPRDRLPELPYKKGRGRNLSKGVQSESYRLHRAQTSQRTRQGRGDIRDGST